MLTEATTPGTTNATREVFTGYCVSGGIIFGEGGGGGVCEGVGVGVGVGIGS